MDVQVAILFIAYSGIIFCAGHYIGYRKAEKKLLPICRKFIDRYYDLRISRNST